MAEDGMDEAAPRVVRTVSPPQLTSDTAENRTSTVRPADNRDAL